MTEQVALESMFTQPESAARARYIVRGVARSGWLAAAWRWVTGWRPMLDASPAGEIATPSEGAVSLHMDQQLWARHRGDITELLTGSARVTVAYSDGRKVRFAGEQAAAVMDVAVSLLRHAEAAAAGGGSQNATGD